MFNHLKVKVHKKEISDQSSVKTDNTSLKRAPSIESINSTATSENRSKKRDELVKKWEGKVQTLVYTVREKNSKIEDLEDKLNHEKSNYERKIIEIKESSALNVKSLLDEHRVQMQQLEQQRDKLQKKVVVADDRAEILRTQCFGVDEDRENVKDLSRQELAKVKHLLRLNENEMEETQTRLADLTAVADRLEADKECLGSDLQKKQADIVRIAKEREVESEERRSQQTTIRGLLTDKEGLEHQLEDVKAKLSKSESMLGKVERASAEMHSRLQQSAREQEQWRSKHQHLETDKFDREEAFKDRIRSLETHMALLRDEASVEEQVRVLEEKCFKLESRNREERELKDEVLKSWSERVASLETQISNLNEKIAEDSQELSSHNEAKTQIREGFERQVKEAHQDVTERGKRLVSLQEQLDAASNGLAQQKKVWEREEARLIEECQRRATEGSTLAQECFDLKKEQVKLQEQLNCLTAELRMKSSSSMKADEEVKRLKEELEEKSEELNSLNNERFKRELKVTDLTSQVSSLETVKTELEKTAAQVDADFKSVQKQLKAISEEKEGLRRRVDHLLEQQQQLRVECDHRIKTMQTEVDSRVRELELNYAREQELEEQVRELEMERETILVGVESSEVLQLKSQLEQLSSQLSDKNNVIRNQKQKISDLKKTLGKEMRSNNGSLTQVESTAYDKEFSKFRNNSSTSLCDHLHSSTSTSIPNRPLFPRPVALSGQPTNRSPILASDGASSSGDDVPVVVDKNGYVIMDQINFKYLRHVLLKFLLSKGSEASQLVRAVATLLRLSSSEEDQIRFSIEARRKSASWFHQSSSSQTNHKSSISRTSKMGSTRLH